MVLPQGLHEPRNTYRFLNFTSGDQRHLSVDLEAIRHTEARENSKGAQTICLACKVQQLRSGTDFRMIESLFFRRQMICYERLGQWPFGEGLTPAGYRAHLDIDPSELSIFYFSRLSAARY
jgi:hypothetical protein